MYWGRKKNIIRLTEEKEWEKNKIGMEGRGKVGGRNWSWTKKKCKRGGKKGRKKK